MSTTRSMTVADAMTFDPIVVRVDASIEEAQHELQSRHITGLPVVDEHGTLVGVISQTDLLREMPSAGAMLRGRPSGLRVGELMTSPPITVSMTASLVEAARAMRTNAVHRVVVLDDDRPIGVLSASDYVALIADGWVGI